MADVTLHDGREVNIDLYKVTRREFSAFFRPEISEGEEDEFLAKVTGLTADEISALAQPDFDLLVRAVGLKRRELASNPI